MPYATLTSETDIRSRLQRAVALFRSRELVAARATCEALIADAATLPSPDLPGALTADAVTADASYWAARCARRQELPDDSLRFIYAGIVCAGRSGHAQAECLLRAELVHVLSAIGQNNDALEQADVALRRAAHLEHALGAAAAQEALASVYWMTKEWDLGFPAYETALEMAVACGSLELRVLCTLGMAAALEDRAENARQLGRLDETESWGRKSVQLQREGASLAAELGDEHLVMYGEINCCCSLYAMRALDEAQALLETYANDPTRTPVHGAAFTLLGEIARDRGRPEEALALLLKAQPITEAAQKVYPRLAVLEALVEVYETLGNPVAALACMRSFHRLHVANASDKSRMLARALTVKHDTERAIAVAQAQRQRADQLERSNADLAVEAALHARESMEDSLTGMANRRRFDQAMGGLLDASGRLEPCSVAMLDVDHFKRVNDAFSHSVGDAVLRRIGALMVANSRRDDLAARHGGEEFVLLGTQVLRAEMLQMCERIRRAVEQEDWSAIRPGLQVTVSIGVAHHDELPAGLPHPGEALLALADERLYAAKHGGRNQVHGGESSQPVRDLAVPPG